MRQSSQKHEIITLKALLHRPLSDSTIGAYGHKGFTLTALTFRDPLDIPDSVGVFVEGLAVFGDGGVGLFADVVDGDRAVLGATSDEVGVLDAELAGGEGEFAGEDFLWEGGVF